MTGAEREAKLRQAVQLIAQVALDLDIKVEKCPTCKHDHLVNWSEGQGFKELSAINAKLERWIGRLK